MATSFILSTPKPKFSSFSPTSTTRSDDSNSSYDDGPAENGRQDKFPVMEHRMYVINRMGNGEASYLLLTEDARSILSYRVHIESWMPIVGVMNFQVVVLDQWIYIIGGFEKATASCLKSVIRYDPREGQWVRCKEMILARCKFGACVVNGKIFVCGGERSDGKVTGSCEMYDPEENEWSKCGMLLAPRANAACVGYGKDILCAGGFNGGIAHNNLWLYEHHQWQELDEHYPHTLPYCLDKCAVAAVDNTFFFMGGVSNETPPEDISAGRLRKKSENAKHVTLSLPKDTSTPNSNVSTNSKISSNSSSSSTNTTTTTKNAYTNSTKRSNQRTQNGKHKKGKSKAKDDDPLPFKPCFHTERRAFAFTTSIQAGEGGTSLDHLDLISPWNLKVPPMIHARHSAGAVVVGHKMYVVGGNCIETGRPVQTSEHFNFNSGQWEEDFTLRRCDVSNVTCVVVDVPKVPFAERKNTYRLRWVMW